MKVGELFIQLGVEADTAKLTDFARGIGEMTVASVAAIAGIASVAVAIRTLSENAIQSAIAFSDFTSQTGLAWGELQKWQLAAEQANVSTDAVASSIKSLQQNLVNIRMGEGNISGFQLLGISPDQDAFGVLNQLRQAIKGLDNATAVNMIQRIGLSPEMIRVLRLSEEEFDRIAKASRGMTMEQEQTFLRVKKSVTEFAQVMRGFSFEVMNRVLLDFESLGDIVKALNINIPLLVASIGLLAAAFAPVTAGAVALLLVLDDLATYARGGDSLIGDIIGDKKSVGQAVKSPQAWGQAIFKALGNVGGPLGFMLTGGGSAPMPALVGAGAGPMVNQTNNITVNSNDPDAAGEAVRRHLERGISDAALQTDNGGRR